MCCAGRGTPSAHEMTTGRVFYQKISPIKAQIVIYRAGLGRTRAGTPFVLPSLATRASHLGNPGYDFISGVGRTPVRSRGVKEQEGQKRWPSY